MSTHMVRSTIARNLSAAHRADQPAGGFGDLLAWRGIAASIVEAAATVGARAETVSGSRATPHKWEIVGHALGYLQDHFLTKFTLAQLAAHCNLSVSRFSSIFTEIMHISPMDYRNRLRIHHAAERILKTSDKIAAVGEECGLESQSQFSALFKRIVGFPPAFLRENRIHSTAGN